MKYNKHVTLYGDSLSDVNSPEWEYLSGYNTIICSPGVFSRIKNKRPDLMKKCIIYFDFFCSPRKNFMSPYDILPCPGDVYPKRKIYMKHHGGDSYLYYITEGWLNIFMKGINSFCQTYKGKIAGIFLDEWTISHTWWQIDAQTKKATQVSAVEQRRMMTAIEKYLLKVVDSTTTQGILLANGEVISQQRVRIYHESVGSNWNPWALVLPKTRILDFWQVNSKDIPTRFIAIFLGSKAGVSIGMQPNEGVLSYNIVEDTTKWPN